MYPEESVVMNTGPEISPWILYGLLSLSLTIVGAIELVAVFTILKSMKNRILNSGLPVIVMLFGLYWFRDAWAHDFVLFTSIMFAGPMTVLIVAFNIPSLEKPEPGFMRIAISYVCVTLFGYIFSMLFRTNHLPLITGLYSDTIVSKSGLFFVLILLEFLFVVCVFKIMTKWDVFSTQNDMKSS